MTLRRAALSGSVSLIATFSSLIWILHEIYTTATSTYLHKQVFIISKTALVLVVPVALTLFR